MHSWAISSSINAYHTMHTVSEKKRKGGVQMSGMRVRGVNN